MAVPVRPLYAVTLEELDHYWHTTPALRRAWKENAPHLKMYDARGVNRRTFIWGWICALRAQRQAVARMQMDLLSGLDRLATKAQDQASAIGKIETLD